MVDSDVRNTTFEIHFRHYIDKSRQNIFANPERKYGIINEEIHAVVVARHGNITSSEDLQIWKSHIEQLTCIACLSSKWPASCLEQNVGGDQKINAKKYRCTPIESIKKTEYNDPKKSGWITVNTNILVHPIYIERLQCDNISSTAIIWASLWQDTATPADHMVPLEISFKDAHPDITQSQTGKSLVHIICRNLPVLSPPQMEFRHLSVSGNHSIYLTVSNPNIKCSINIQGICLVPVVCGNSSGSASGSNSDVGTTGEITPDANVIIQPTTTEFPTPLLAVESQIMRFPVIFNQELETGSCMEVQLTANTQWNIPDMLKHVSTQYTLPSFVIRKPGLIISTAAEIETPSCGKSFSMLYTITNNLHNFNSLQLVWNPERALKEAIVKGSKDLERKVSKLKKSVVCHKPTTILGQSLVGSSVTVSVDYQILQPGLYELGQHMKLNIQNVPATSGSHQERRGSITSTRSMPVDPLTNSKHDFPPKSSSMGPIVATKRVSNSLPRQGTSSMRDAVSLLATVPTPSYHSVPSSPCHGARSWTGHSSPTTSGLNSPSAAGPRTLGSPLTSGPQTYCPTVNSGLTTSRSQSSAQSTTGGITAQQVLKKNCQVYVFN